MKKPVKFRNAPVPPREIVSQSDNPSRWWEFYAVRYGMGTVVGGIIFFFLCNANPTLQPMLFGAGSGKFNAPLLTLLAGYGLAYCYIASAPILVLHAGRFLFNPSQGFKVSWLSILILIIPPAIATLIFFYMCPAKGPTLYLFSSVFALAALVIWPQYPAITFTLFRTKKLFEFYKNLEDKRDAAKDGFVESYKHLREHGNSFFIVTLEILFAIILFAAGSFVADMGVAATPTKELYVLTYIGIILLWILPAALVRLVGTLIEREFYEA